MIFQRLLEKSTSIPQILRDKKIGFQKYSQFLAHHRFALSQYLILYFCVAMFFGIVERTIFLSITVSTCLLVLSNHAFHCFDYIITKITPQKTDTFVVCFSNQGNYLINDDHLNPSKPTILVYCHTDPLKIRSIIWLLYLGVFILPFTGIATSGLAEKIRLVVCGIFFILSCLFDIPRTDVINQIFPIQLLFSLIKLLPQSKVRFNVVIAFISGNEGNSRLVRKLTLLYDPSYIFYISSSPDKKTSHSHCFWEVPPNWLSFKSVVTNVECSLKQQSLFESCDILHQQHQRDLQLVFHRHLRNVKNPFITRQQIHFVLRRGIHKFKHQTFVIDGQLIIYLQNFNEYFMRLLESLSYNSLR